MFMCKVNTNNLILIEIKNKITLAETVYVVPFGTQTTSQIISSHNGASFHTYIIPVRIMHQRPNVICPFYLISHISALGDMLHVLLRLYAC